MQASFSKHVMRHIRPTFQLFYLNYGYVCCGRLINMIRKRPHSDLVYTCGRIHDKDDVVKKNEYVPITHFYKDNCPPWNYILTIQLPTFTHTCFPTQQQNNCAGLLCKCAPAADSDSWSFVTASSGFFLLSLPRSSDVLPELLLICLYANNL